MESSQVAQLFGQADGCLIIHPSISSSYWDRLGFYPSVENQTLRFAISASSDYLPHWQRKFLKKKEQQNIVIFRIYIL